MHTFLFNCFLLLLVNLLGLKSQLGWNPEKIDWDRDEPMKITDSCESDLYDESLICGIGIEGKDNARCIPWGQSIWNNDGKLENTTFCKSYRRYFYCATSIDTWSYCNSLQCQSTKSDSICNRNIFWSSTLSSIRLDFTKVSKPNNLIIFTYLKENECQVANVCQNCDSVDDVIHKHFKACKRTPYKHEDVCTLPNLSADAFYQYYIIPVINIGTIGSIVRISVKTKPTMPSVSQCIQLIEITENSISIQWNNTCNSKAFGPVKSYRIITYHLNHTETYDTINNYYTAENLQVCTVYSFKLMAVYSTYESKHSIPIHVETKAVLSEIKLVSISLQSTLSVIVEWKYIPIQNCSILFRVQILEMNYQGALFEETTNNTSIFRDRLSENRVYFVRVRPQYKNESGTFSKKRIFHTMGKMITNANLQHKEDGCHLSWKLSIPPSLQSYGFQIRIEDKQKQCLFPIIAYKCKPNCSHLNKVGIMDYDEPELIIGNCGTPIDKPYDAIDTSFRIPNCRIAKVVIKYYIDNIFISSINLSWFQENDRNYYDFLRDNYKILYLSIIGCILVAIAIGINVLVCFRKTLCRHSLSINGNASDHSEQGQSNSFRYSGTFRSILTYINERDLSNHKRKLTKEFLRLRFEENVYEKCSGTISATSSLETVLLDNCGNNMTGNSQQKTDSNYNLIDAHFIPFVDDPTKIEYVACQGPNQEMFSDFASMLWEQNISVIVMLTRTYDSMTIMRLQYWYNNDGDNVYSFAKNCGFVILLVKETITKLYTERILKIINKISNKKRKIIQLHMHTWNDFINPTTESMEVMIIRFHEIIAINKPPFLVHCSAGPQKAGTFIAIDRIIRKISGGDRFVNVFQEVTELQKYQSFKLQLKTQYIFIHEFIQYYLKTYLFDDIYPDQDFYDKIHDLDG